MKPVQRENQLRRAEKEAEVFPEASQRRYIIVEWLSECLIKLGESLYQLRSS